MKRFSAVFPLVTSSFEVGKLQVSSSPDAGFWGVACRQEVVKSKNKIR